MRCILDMLDGENRLNVYDGVYERFGGPGGAGGGNLNINGSTNLKIPSPHLDI